MKKIAFIFVLIFLISSCDNNETNSVQLFRNIYNNTTWTDSDGVKYSFKTDKLFYVTDNLTCTFCQTGTYNNIEYDGCVYNTVTNTVASEDNDTFSVKQITSAGVGSFCPPSSARLTFQILDQNTIEVHTDYDGTLDSFIINKTNNVSTQNSVDATSIGLLW